MKNNKLTYVILITLGLGMIILLLFYPIEQNQAYHDFCDQNSFFGISNFWNVVSNIPFIIVGCFGLLKLRFFSENKLQYFVLFIGVILVSFGSSYYHLIPSDQSLLWDRLPMTFVFIAIVSIVISEFLNSKVGKRALFPLIILGILSILIWKLTGDLRLYTFLQFYPMLAIPIVLVSCKAENTNRLKYWVLLIMYVAAKCFEYYDCSIYLVFGSISGHTLKHIFSAFGLLGFAILASRKKHN